MPDYHTWNNAVATYFTANVPRGTSVFLTLNDDALMAVAANFIDETVETRDAAADFAAAVRDTVVDGGSVCLSEIKKPRLGEIPAGIAFLGLMVLAAHRMAGDQTVNATNYFLRLTQMLDVSTGHGNRPAGMGTGEEEALWIQWNRWLQEQGWQATARPGPEGPHRFLDYVLTQALIRDDDSIYLQGRFRQNLGLGGISRAMDEVQLAGWLQRTSAITRRHLREGFCSNDPRRAAAFFEAAYRVFEATAWDGGTAVAAAQRARVLNAGLSRSVSLGGQVSFRMLVPQPTNWMPKPLMIRGAGGAAVPLRPGRLGHFATLDKQAPFVAESLRFALEGDPLLDGVVFPRRDFWILTPDPEDPTGAYATWEKFPNLLGQKFTIICPTEGEQFVQDELEKFREAKLIQWDSTESLPGFPVHEYRGCMILSSGWEGVVPSEECVGLLEALKPRQFAAISLAEGIRAPGQNAWLVGHPPEVKIYGFEETFVLRLSVGEEEKFAIPQFRQQSHLLDAELPAGVYSLEVEWNEQVLATRTFRIIDWDDLEMGEQRSGEKPGLDIGGRLLGVSGAVLELAVNEKEVR